MLVKPNRILLYQEGYYVMQMKNNDDVEKVLHNRPYYMNRRIIIVRKWVLGFDFSE